MNNPKINIEMNRIDKSPTDQEIHQTYQIIQLAKNYHLKYHGINKNNVLLKNTDNIFF